MRMWMVDPRFMCRQHLLGEAVEMHMFYGSLLKGISMKGYLANNLFEPRSLKARHDLLAEEMAARGFNHKSPMPDIDLGHLPDVFVDAEASLRELLRRCPECKARYEALIN